MGTYGLARVELTAAERLDCVVIGVPGGLGLAVDVQEVRLGTGRLVVTLVGCEGGYLAGISAGGS